MDRHTFAHRHPWPLFAVGLLIGCALADPGGQTATALRQRFEFGWDELSRFTAGGDGTQTGSFTMIEGELVLDDAGQVDVTRSKITAYLTYAPKADAAASAYTAALQASTAQVEALSAQIGGLFQLLLPTLISQQHAREPPETP